MPEIADRAPDTATEWEVPCGSVPLATVSVVGLEAVYSKRTVATVAGAQVKVGIKELQVVDCTAKAKHFPHIIKAKAVNSLGDAWHQQNTPHHAARPSPHVRYAGDNGHGRGREHARGHGHMRGSSRGRPDDRTQWHHRGEHPDQGLQSDAHWRGRPRDHRGNGGGNAAWRRAVHNDQQHGGHRSHLSRHQNQARVVEENMLDLDILLPRTDSTMGKEHKVKHKVYPSTDDLMSESMTVAFKVRNAEITFLKRFMNDIKAAIASMKVSDERGHDAWHVLACCR